MSPARNPSSPTDLKPKASKLSITRILSPKCNFLDRKSHNNKQDERSDGRFIVRLTLKIISSNPKSLDSKSLLPKRTVRFRIPSYVPHLRPSFPVRYPTPLDQISFLSMFGKTINFCMVINLNLRQLWTLISPVPCALGRQRQFLI